MADWLARRARRAEGEETGYGEVKGQEEVAGREGVAGQEGVAALSPGQRRRINEWEGGGQIGGDGHGKRAKEGGTGVGRG